ncbi:hypothetical protein ACJX0J_041852, partial [Zea mays]
TSKIRAWVSAATIRTEGVGNRRVGRCCRWNRAGLRPCPRMGAPGHRGCSPHPCRAFPDAVGFHRGRNSSLEFNALADRSVRVVKGLCATSV